MLSENPPSVLDDKEFMCSKRRRGWVVGRKLVAFGEKKQRPEIFERDKFKFWKFFGG